MSWGRKMVQTRACSVAQMHADARCGPPKVSNCRSSFVGKPPHAHESSQTRRDPKYRFTPTTGSDLSFVVCPLGTHGKAPACVWML